MSAMRALLALVILAGLTGPAAAHRLKLFATVDDGAIAGYGFFIGGGRPQGATLVIRDSAGADVFRGATDDTGAFSWRPPAPGDFALLIDARDGHVAEARIGAERFAGDASPAAPAAAASAPAAATAPVPAAGTACAPDPAVLAAAIDRAVDTAVARATRPLLEAYAEADGRVRFNDVAGGIGMIVGLAGIALWASARRRPPPSPPAGGSP
jgi:nickel transport protein